MANDAPSAGGLDGGNADQDRTKVVQNYDHGTVFSNPAGTNSRDILDGVSNVVVLVEARREIPWTRPEDIPYFADKPLPNLGGWFSQGWHAGFADGKVKLLSADNEETTIRHLFTIGDGHHIQPNFVSIASETNIANESLEGVWEQVLPPEIAAARPEDQRLRLVFAGDWHATFRGSQRVSVSHLKVEPQHTPKRLSFFGVEGKPMRGIYEVKETGLRLSIAPDTEGLPTKFGTEDPEFKRVNGKLADEQLEALKRHAKERTPTDDSPTKSGTAPDLRLVGDEVSVDGIARLADRPWGCVTLYEGRFNGEATPQVAARRAFRLSPRPIRYPSYLQSPPLASAANSTRGCAPSASTNLNLV